MLYWYYLVQVISTNFEKKITTRTTTRTTTTRTTNFILLERDARVEKESRMLDNFHPRTLFYTVGRVLQDLVYRTVQIPTSKVTMSHGISLET